jgi:CRISPR-associated protein Cas1
LDRLVIVGTVQLTTQALALLLDRRIPTSFISIHGDYRGRLEPPASKNILLRYKQYQLHGHEAWRLQISKIIVGAKIANGRALLMQHARNHPETDIAGELAAMEHAMKAIENQPAVDSMLGVEGSAAAAYFHALGKMVRKEFTFERRTKHPPLDPVNSLLSLGYTLICNELAGALSCAGLDPYLGFFHDLRYGRPSLAGDLMEEFRYAMDALALTLVNKEMLRAQDFERQPDGAFYLTEAGREVFFKQYEKKVTSAPSEAGGEGALAYRQLFARQAAGLARAVECEGQYQPHKVE